MFYKPAHARQRGRVGSGRLSRAAAIVAALVTCSLVSLGLTAAANATTPTPLFTVTTHVTDDPDSGGAGNWSYDTFDRTFSVYANPGGCALLPSGDVCYSATISDAGTFVTIPGAYQPNQGDPSAQTRSKISSPSVSGTFSGSSGYVFYAPGADLPAAANVNLTVKDNFTVPSGEDTTSHWYLQAFTVSGQPAVTGTESNDWTWTYKTGCETWTDAWNNSDGQSANLAADGNITGAVCPVPAPTPTASTPLPPPPVSAYGDEVNPFGNGFDVFQQRDHAGAIVAGWQIGRAHV